ncbi:Oleosin [Artemisia annua]|uniref:Oleosin n=1 Tax=Artemisia annua TaxID=35608 RepID=A0A2U1MSR2_ARTAN|nr:Oleosin [Artemisia annua]
MADRFNFTGQPHLKKQPKPTTKVNINNGGASLRNKLRRSSSFESTELMGFMALLVSSAILLILDGITVTTSVVGLILFIPFVIITSPIWVTFGALLFLFVTGVVFLSSLGLVAAVLVFWLSK